MTRLPEISRSLSQAGSDCPELEALLLCQQVTGLSQEKILGLDQIRLSDRQSRQLKRLIRARTGQPLAYLVGWRWFWGHRFWVGPGVLVPRPESESLIELALGLKQPFETVYDLGTGSGCLGISYYLSADCRPRRLELIDRSAASLNYARANCRRLGVEAGQRLADFRQLAADFYQPGSLIIANLPYLDDRRRHYYYDNCPELKAEPATALFEATGAGLGLYDCLLGQIQTPAVSLIIETLQSQQESAIALGQKHHWRLKQRLGLGLAFDRPPA